MIDNKKLRTDCFEFIGQWFCSKSKNQLWPNCHPTAIFAVMKVLMPIGYFPPISYFAWLIGNEVTLEKKEHFVKQSLRSRCTIMGANGPLNLLVPREKASDRLPMNESIIHNVTDWKTLHWRSLEAAYRNSPYFEYYEDKLQPFFEQKHTHHFQLGLESIELVCQLLNMSFEPSFTEEYLTESEQEDLRNAWNKRDYAENQPVKKFPNYIQVFSDRHPFAPDLSILDLLFCSGPQATEYLKNLELSDH